MDRKQHRLNKSPRSKKMGYPFSCRAGMVDEGDLPAARLEGIVPQPFQPYKLNAVSSEVLSSRSRNKMGSRSGQAMAELLIGLVGILLLVVGLQQVSIISQTSFSTYFAARADVAEQMTESFERYSGDFQFADRVDPGPDGKAYTADDQLVVGDNSFYTDGNGFMDHVGYPGADEIGDRLNEYDRIDPYSELADTSDTGLSEKHRMHFGADEQPVDLLPVLRKALGKDSILVKHEMFMPSWNGLMEDQ